MPYDVLEAVEDAAIRDKHTPVEVFAAAAAALSAVRRRRSSRSGSSGSSGCGAATSGSASAIAPCFHLDDHNLDPRSWCRFPILSGGFERELAELRAYVARQADR